MPGRDSRGTSSLHPALRWSALGLGSLLLCGCLKINADYNVQAHNAASPETPSLAQSTQPAATAIDQDSTTTQPTAPPPASTNTTTDATSTEVSEELPGTETSSASAATTSDTATEFPVDTNDGVWTPFRVTLAGSASAPLPVGYAMQVFVDHDAIVNNGGDPGGADLALVYVQGGIGRSLHRWRDPQNPWNHQETRLWFNLQQPLNPGDNQTDTYYLVRGSSVFSPKEDPNQIFLAYDDFQGGSFKAQTWQDVDDAVGSSEIVSTTDGLSIQVSSQGTEQQRRSLVSIWNQFYFGVLAETRYRIPSSVDESCNRMVPVAFETSSDNRVRHGIGLNLRRWRRAAYSNNSGEVEFKNITDSLPNEDGNWHRYAITWHDDKAGIWRDGQLIDWVNALNQGVNRPSQQAIRLRLAAQAEPGGCTGTSMSQIEFDWVWLRPYSNPEPQSFF